MALISVADALKAVLDGAAGLAIERVALDAAHRRVLAEDLASLRTQPPQAMSAMDGYAVRSADAAAVPARLAVIGEIAAGRPPDTALGEGQALRIFTGGVVPDGADAVVIQEDTARDGDVVIVNEPARLGRHIRPAGVDFKHGEVLLRAGARLSDRDLALAAGMNHPDLPVYRRPRVAMLATGDELVMPGTEPLPGQIVYSNGYALKALARDEGADIVDLGIAADTIAATTAAIRSAREQGCDLLVTTGGASAGDHDLVKTSLEAEGTEMAFWKIAMRPGKPMMHGRLGAMRVIGLPGNPVSSYVCAVLFMVPLIRALSGMVVAGPAREPAVLGRAVAANDQREDYLRATLSVDADGRPVATTVDQQDSSLLGRLSQAQVLIIRPPFAPAQQAGAPCQVLRLPA